MAEPNQNHTSRLQRHPIVFLALCSVLLLEGGRHGLCMVRIDGTSLLGHRLRTLQNSWTKQKNAINQEMKIHVC